MSDLTLVNQTNGEVLPIVDALALLAAAGIDDLKAATTVDLAAFADNTRQLQSVTNEARGIVSDELVYRLDQAGRWTWRDDGWEVKAPSPEAGTTRYHTHLLRDALAQLVADGVISPEGARSAVDVEVATVAVPYELLRRARSAVNASLAAGRLHPPEWESVTSEIDELLADEPTAPSYYQRPAGIRNLCKIPAARAAIEACRLPATPPPRTARVRRLPT